MGCTCFTRAQIVIYFFFVFPVFQPGSPTLRILQLSDIHVDLLYKAGSNANCGEPLCCRGNDGPPGTLYKYKEQQGSISI